MKIQYASDLHLEFDQNTDWLSENPLEVTGDVLVLAGDITIFGDEALETHPFFEWCAQNYRETLLVPGNHEYYRGVEMRDTLTDFEKLLHPNVRYHFQCIRYMFVRKVSSCLGVIAWKTNEPRQVIKQAQFKRREGPIITIGNKGTEQIVIADSTYVRVYAIFGIENIVDFLENLASDASELLRRESIAVNRSHHRECKSI